jgi:hypothetical protein
VSYWYLVSYYFAASADYVEALRQDFSTEISQDEQELEERRMALLQARLSCS